MILVSLSWYHWLIIGIGTFLIISLLFSIWLTFTIAKHVYQHTLTRLEGGAWGRECSAPENKEQLEMWNEGLEWAKKFSKQKEDLTITSFDGLKLMAEFYNFNSERTVVFLCGRCECLCYAYYYAKAYQEQGINCLFIDQRCHGLSEGTYSTVGILESKDTLKWLEYLKEHKGLNRFLLHCVCVGGATGLLMAASKECDVNIERITLDGAFINFNDSYKRHYVGLGHHLFPVYYQIWYWFKKRTGVSVKLSNPLEAIKNIHCPVLFLYGKLDNYSPIENGKILFNACPSDNKKMIIFDEGSHSHLRINNKTKYDQSIIDFVKE